MKMITSMKTLALMAGMLLTCNAVQAGDGTKENPYTPAELNAQKEALKAKAQTMLPFETNIVWVKADLKGLGEDGQRTDNADTEEIVGGKNTTVNHLAGLFGDDTDTFVAYSWQILGQVAMEDFTNTKDLLIALTYQEHSHTYANSDNPWQGSNYEPDDFHFSLVEVYGALSLEIKNGYRGFHIPSCYAIPEGVCAVTVNAGYTSSNGAYVKYRYYDGADAQTNVTPKNSAVVLMAKDGTYDFVLTTEYYAPVMATSNALYGGTQAGANVGTKKNRARLRFVCTDGKVGFERNSQENGTVILESKDEVYLEVNSLTSHFYGNWPWETADKDWITWAGGTYADLHADHATFDFTSADLRGYIGETSADTKGWIYNETFTDHFISLQVVTGTSPYKNYTDNNKGNCLVVYKDGFLIFRAPKGSAVAKIEFTLASGSDLKATPSSGALEGLEWTGNAEGVRFAITATRYIANVAVTIADKDAETSALPAIEYTNCANIAAFNALEDGTYAVVPVDNAEVIAKSSDGVTTVYIQDATGGTALKYSSYNELLTEKKRLFGRVYVRKMSSLMMEAEDAGKGEALPQDLDELTVTEGTLAEVNVAENLGRLVKITGASFAATSATAGTLTQGESTIVVNNGGASDIKYLHKITDTWVKNETKMDNVTITAILVAKTASSGTTYELLPLSMTSETATGIVNANAADVNDFRIYNLQGVRLDKVQRGLNVVNGRKLLVK